MAYACICHFFIVILHAILRKNYEIIKTQVI